MQEFRHQISTELVEVQKLCVAMLKSVNIVLHLSPEDYQPPRKMTGQNEYDIQLCCKQKRPKIASTYNHTASACEQLLNNLCACFDIEF